MNFYFTNTLADLSFNKVSNESGEDEKPFIDDLTDDKITEVGHIQFVPAQNRIRITAAISNEEIKTYDIINPHLDLLTLIFQNTNHKVKRAIRFYAHNSSNARQQHVENRV